MNFLERAGDTAEALTYARRLDELEPGDPRVQPNAKRAKWAFAWLRCIAAEITVSLDVESMGFERHCGRRAAP